MGNHPKPLTPAEVRSRFRAEISRAGGLRSLALEWDVHAGTLSMILNGEGDSIPPALLAPLGLRKVVQSTTLYVSD